MFYSWMHAGLEVRATDEKGKGIFATAQLTKGDILCVFGGQVIADREFDRLAQERPILEHFGLKLEAGRYLITPEPGKDFEPADYFNHSCDPNAGMHGQVTLVAMRDIQPGEEVTFDYAMIDDEEDWGFPCHCQSPHCRTRITGKDWQSPELQRRYAGFFTTYMQALIDKGKD